MTMLLCLNFYACSSDDEIKDYKQMIVGVWLTSDYEESIVFYDNGTGVSLDYDENYNEGLHFDWVISNSTLAVTFEDGYSNQMTIKELTNKSMTLSVYDAKSGKTETETFIRK